MSMLILLLCAAAQETVWVEAEHLQGVRGYCWPGGPDPKTDGRWGVSGPGWAAEWTQGGESNFMSIACGPGDDQAAAGLDVDLPAAGLWRVWVRYRDNRGMSSRFRVRAGDVLLTYGEKPVVEEDNELKLYWDWAFAWDVRDATLPAGRVRLELLSAFAEKGCRQVDCVVLTTDGAYRPRIKERPRHPTHELLARYAKGVEGLEPLAKKSDHVPTPLKTFRDRGFLYLWNMDQTKWASDDPKRVPVPYHLRDKEALEAFEKMYAGAKDVPIFSDPRITPVFHGAGPYAIEKPELRRWLDAHPDRAWGLMMNYHPDKPLSAEAKEAFAKYRDRYVGNVSGESLGYFYPDEKVMVAATAGARTRRQLVEAFTPLTLASNAAKQKKVYGEDGDYRDVIPCKSIGMTAFAPLCYPWGARTVGYESSAITAGLLSMRQAFLRGAARQNGGLTAVYRSCNFGDAATIFSETGSFTKPKNILDNYYSVFSGAGMTWYKMDLWYQYMAGASMFYHEQGFDEFWIPGGTGAAGVKPLQLSPKGKLVDRFLRVSAAHPDRGTPFTPVAFLVDYAHGWDASPFEPHAFGNWGKRPDLTLYGEHERMLRELFWIAYHPIGVKAEEPITATNEVYVPGVFGDLFDVVYAYPDVKRWTTIDTYPAVVAAGDLELTLAEGKRLADYVENGGTLLLCEGQTEALELPERGQLREAEGYAWLGEKAASQRYRFRPLSGGRPLATTPDGAVVCAAYERGKGRLIYLSVPRGLGVDRSAVPVLARLVAHLTRGLAPVEVDGGVEWALNRTSTGWIVTLLNPAGQAKPQHGITPTDFRENRDVTIRTAFDVASAADWLMPDDPPSVKGRAVKLTVPAGGVRVVEIRGSDR